MVGLCLVAVFAIAAVAATSASALPEWGKCEKVAPKTGGYTDANCTKKAKPLNSGEFKFVKGKELKNVKFTGHNVGSGGVLVAELWDCPAEGGRFTRKQCEEKGSKYEANGEVSIECEEENSNGEAHSTNQIINVSVRFKGCKVFGSLPCSNSPIEGEIQTETLKGNLGYISKPEKKVGVLLTPAKAKGQFAKFNCAGAIGTVVGVGNSKQGAFYEPETTGGYDGIISPITPVNTMTSEYTQVYTVNPANHQNVPSKFEGKHIELLESYVFSPEEPETNSSVWSPAGEEITNVNKPAEAGEIKG